MSTDSIAARAILEPYFLAAREAFHQYCVKRQLGEQVNKTRLECSNEVRDAERHFAGTTLDGRLIVASPELADLPEDTVAAIFAHEFGHVVDHLYPGCFSLNTEELVFYGVLDPRDEELGDVRVARIKQWQQRDHHEIELTADLIAEDVLGHRIGYSGACMLQGFNRGKKRPKSLR